MSGIAAQAVADAGLLDADYFRRWSRTLREIGPDGDVGVTCTETACLASAPFDTFRDQPSAQPLTLDGNVFIVADARLDDRAGLRGALRSAGRDVADSSGDAELLLHAYAAWDSDCVRHLLGDFAFALWDAPRETLLAATDPLGVRPLYWSVIADGILVCNWAPAMYAHRAVDRSPDDEALVRFLAYGRMVQGETAFRGIRVLGAARQLVWRSGRLSIARYWTPPVEDPLRYRDERQYGEHLLDVLTTATAERLRGNAATILMSGGIDSVAVALAAKRAEPAVRFTARTTVYERLIPDDERPYAAIAAAQLGIPVSYHVADAYPPFARPDTFGLDPVPENNPFRASFDANVRAAATDARLLLTGHGADVLLMPEPVGSVLGMHSPLAVASVLRYLPRHFATYRRRPPLGIRLSLTATGRRVTGPRLTTPEWLGGSVSPVAPETMQSHPFRPTTHRLLSGELLPLTFESAAAFARRAHVSIAHPFVDLRVIRFCLRLPPLPFCWDKHALRLALRPHLPPAVVNRRKTPLAGDLLAATIRASGSEWVSERRPGPLTSRYYLWPDFVPLQRLVRSDPDWVHLRPVALEAFAAAWNARQKVE